MFSSPSPTQKQTRSLISILYIRKVAKLSFLVAKNSILKAGKRGNLPAES